MNPQDSKWLVAPNPSRRNSQRAPILAFASGPIEENSVIGWVHSTWK